MNGTIDVVYYSDIVCFDVENFFESMSLEDVEYFIDISPFTERLRQKLLFEIRNYFSIRENRSYLEFKNLKQRILYYLKNVFSFEDGGGLISDWRKLELGKFMSEMSLDNWKNFLEYFQISDEIVEIVEWYIKMSSE